MADWVDAARHLIKKIDAEMDVISDRVSNGGCGTYDDYRYQVGRLHGLRRATDMIRGLLKNVEEHDDKD